MGQPGFCPSGDFGFAGDAHAVLDGMRREREAASLAQSRASIAAALQVIDHCAQTNCDEWPVVPEAGCELIGYRKGAIAQRAIHLIGCRDMRQDELLESVDAILQFVKMVLINSGHGGETPEGGEPAPSTPTPNSPHRLSETD